MNRAEATRRSRGSLIALIIVALMLAPASASPIGKVDAPEYESDGGDPTPVNYYSIDGNGVNSEHPEWGATGQNLGRLSPATHENGSGLGMVGFPNPRAISNIVCDEPIIHNDDAGLSDYNWLWGQFVTHDIDFTLTQNGRVGPNNISEKADITVPEDDVVMLPGSKLPFFRSLYDPETGTNDSNPRQHPNSITTWIDAGVVYGNDVGRSSWLRAFEGGRLKVAEYPEGDLLPVAAGDDETAPGMSFAGFSADVRFIAGDGRANEHIALMAMHVLFMREHNRLADLIDERNPDWTDEQIYQRARKINAAFIQSITYNEFLPSLGIDMGPDSGYNSSVDPVMTNEFATAAFRMGHSQIGNSLLRFEENRSMHPNGHLTLAQGFWTTTPVTQEGGVAPILRGLAFNVQPEADVMFGDDLRNQMFGLPGAGGQDLCAIDIQRGRDHGLSDYNSIREAIGLARVTNWSEITSDPVMAEALAMIYDDVDHVDPLIGMLAEDHAAGGTLGETMNTIIRDQFERMRTGDPYHYAHDAELVGIVDEIANTTLSDIILRNTEIETLQCNVFFAEQSLEEMLCSMENVDDIIGGNGGNGGNGGTGGPVGVTFIDATASSGLDSVDAGPMTYWASYGPGISWADYDNDGDMDTFITARFDQLGLESLDDGRDPATTATGRTHLMRNDAGVFTDVTESAGLPTAGSTALGAAWADYDNDGDVDLYVSNYGNADLSNYNTSGEANTLYRNNGNGTFTDVTATAGVGNHGHSSGAVWADYDHDGNLDLYSMNLGVVNESSSIVRSATNILYHNNGDGTFTDVTVEAGRISGQAEVSHIPNEIVYGDQYSIAPATPPTASSGAILPSHLGHDGRGSGLSWAAIWVDYDNDGWEDLYVASDFGTSPLYHNNGDGTFEVVTTQAGTDKSGTGMGAHAGDIDNDGDLEICQSNFGPNFLWNNQGDGTFSDDAEWAGVGMNILVNWDCHFFDYDLDGDMDLYFGVGRINEYVTDQTNSLYRNDGDVGVDGIPNTGDYLEGDGIPEFTDVAPLLGLAGLEGTEGQKTMGSALADYDNDGDIDILMGHSDGPLILWENQAVQETDNHWLKIRLNGADDPGGSNAGGVGALVTVYMADGRTFRQHAYAGSGFLGSSDPHVHFGLGEDGDIDRVTILWSSGWTQTLKNVDSDSTVQVSEQLPVDLPTKIVWAIIAALAVIAGLALASGVFTAIRASGKD